MNEKFYEMQKPPSNFGIGILILWGSLKAVKWMVQMIITWFEVAPTF